MQYQGAMQPHGLYVAHTGFLIEAFMGIQALIDSCVEPRKSTLSAVHNRAAAAVTNNYNRPRIAGPEDRAPMPIVTQDYWKAAHTPVPQAAAPEKRDDTRPTLSAYQQVNQALLQARQARGEFLPAQKQEAGRSTRPGSVRPFSTLPPPGSRSISAAYRPAHKVPGGHLPSVYNNSPPRDASPPQMFH